MANNLNLGVDLMYESICKLCRIQVDYGGLLGFAFLPVPKVWCKEPHVSPRIGKEVPSSKVRISSLIKLTRNIPAKECSGG